ncbi:MAG: OB-fold nucleic acid binding domain-containing protein, partial [Acidobacteriota bacterium]|nr:OB-fold nucleic acid binding domain-containing protein [Acidobacteriota bacterium]
MSELDQQIENRKRKRDELRSLGVEPYPHRADVDSEPSELRRRFEHHDAERLEAEPVAVRVAGRIQALREHGKTCFLDLYDGRNKLQAMVRKKNLDETAL